MKAEAAMRLALAQARRASGRTFPNPPVGAVLVRGVTRYFVPQEKYERLIQNLAKHRKRLTEALGIPDVTQEIKEKKRREKGERKRKLERELKEVPF